MLGTSRSFNIEFKQFLNEKAELSSDAPPIAKDFDSLLSFYKTMVLLRAFDAKAIAMQRTGKIELNLLSKL